MLTIPSTTNGYPVTSIGEGAFEYSFALTSVTIPDSVTSIRDAAFYGCASLTSVMIPDSVITIGLESFSDCSGLTNIAVDLGNLYYSSANGVLFDKSQVTLIEYPGRNGALTRSPTPLPVSGHQRSRVLP